ncbi:iron transporter FeoB [Nocardioides sp. zg-DK7169]|nr:FeoB small GTPase domain-containing protein [Nocardioides sp. zg-DK7169]NPC97789.1 iron transporter FeoB [Nocardioides sp. zg-DK7169]
MPSTARPAAPPGAECGSCAVHNTANLRRLGLDVGGCDAVVALAGNPNTGKSTVFNALTGLRQHVGNWPGTTVVRAEGACAAGGRTYRVVDLPGCYSLLSTSRDEDVARDFLLFADPDVVVVVVDATRLERNLNLVLQVLQVTGRVVVALNLMDEARRHRIGLDVRHLSRELEVPVVAMAARRGEGIGELLEQVAAVAHGAWPVRPARPGPALPPGTARAVEELTALLVAEYPGLANARWVALRLLEGDLGTERALRDGSLAGLARSQVARSQVARSA